jgi:hypothetical protein
MSRENKETEQKKSCQNNNKLIVKQFCENTSIHGLKYIFEDGSILIERYYAFIIIIFKRKNNRSFNFTSLFPMRVD